MKLFAVLAALAACGKGADGKAEQAPEPSLATPKPTVTPIAVDAALDAYVMDEREAEARRIYEKIKAEEAEKATKEAADARKDAAAAKKFDVAAIVGKTKGQVAKVLGGRGDAAETSVDGVSYDIADVALVRVEFESGRACMFSLTGHEVLDSMEARTRLLAVAAVTSEHDWNQENNSIEVWDADARARAKERHRVAGAIGGMLERLGAGGAHSRGECQTILLVRGNEPTENGGCTRADLLELRKTAKAELAADLGALGFARLQCGLEGPSINAK
jgi:hypothetical protein